MGQKKGKNEMYDDIMDDINNKAAEDANRMVFFGPDVTAQALLFFQGRISDAPEGTDYPPPPRVMLNPEFQGRSFNEIAEALDRYLEAFKKIELMALKNAVLEVLFQCEDPLDDLEKILAAHDEGDEYSPDDVVVWQPYATNSLQELVDRIDTIREGKLQEYAKVISLATGIDFKSN